MINAKDGYTAFSSGKRLQHNKVILAGGREMLFFLFFPGQPGR